MAEEVTSGVLVYMRHIRAAGICGPGVTTWFPHHGIDKRRLRKGLPVEELEATGEPAALKVAAIARAEHNGQ